jgi:hypothetical protein
MDSLPRFPAALLALLAPLAGACGGADPPAAEPAPPAAAGRSASGSVGPAASADEPARDVSPLVGDPGPLPDAPAEGLAHWRGTFEEEAAARGLSYRNRSGRPGTPTILEANGSPSGRGWRASMP